MTQTFGLLRCCPRFIRDQVKNSRIAFMDIALLDYWFPFIVLFYGVVLTVVFHIPSLVKIGQSRLPREREGLGAAVVCPPDL